MARRSMVTSRKGKGISSLLVILRFAMSSSSSSSSAIIPIARTRELLHLAENTMWNRELKAASEIVKQRRKQRKLERKRRRDRERQRQRQRQRRDRDRGLRYNDYLPEDAPGSLLALIDYKDEDDDQDDDPLATNNAASCLSPLQKWFVSLIVSIGIDTWDEIDAFNITSLAYLYKHHISFDDSDEYFGTYGDRTEEMKANHESLIAFWSGQQPMRSGGVVENNNNNHNNNHNNNNNMKKKNNVILLGMHGVDLAENDKLVPTLQQLYHLDPREAYARATRIQQLIQSLPGAFNNPILTANAIAIQSVVLTSDHSSADSNDVDDVDDDGRESSSSSSTTTTTATSKKEERDSIIVGDGVFEFLEWLKLKKDGPDYIHSHEFGHHLQYDLGVDTNYANNKNKNKNNNNNDNNNNEGLTPGEHTRRWEMMADALGSYYLAHAAGARMSSARLLEVHRAAFSLGDCEDAVGSHHGTPRQRECASNYGANLALTSYLDGSRYVMPPGVLRRMFDGDYVGILELEDGLCEAVVDASVLDETVYGEVSVVGSYAAAAAVDGGGGGSGNGGDNGDDGGADSFPVSTPPANNDLDRPPPRIQNNGTQHDEEDEGWYGGTRSQWRMPRSAGVSLDARLAFAIAVLVTMII